MDGILIINKEKGFTSHDVVAKLRGILHQKKIGHTGTLDPDATGVLPVCLGRATKVCGLLTDTDKIYETVMLLGAETDTQDLSGNVLRSLPVTVSPEEVREAAASFVGTGGQIPPMYSALKVGGRKLCDLARAGKIIEREPRTVTIYGIDILEISLPRVRMRVSCSKGTYIRTLCHDIGRKLGCGAAMEELVRRKAGAFPLEKAITLGEAEEKMREGTLEEVLIPLESMFAHLPRLQMDKAHDKLLANGNPLRFGWGTFPAASVGEAAVYFSDGRFAAVYRWHPEKNLWMPKQMFL